MLVANRFSAPAPLVRVGDRAREWAVQEVFGVDPALLGDDRLARALDTIDPQLEQITGTAGAQAIAEFGIDVNRIHWDMTAISRRHRPGQRRLLTDRRRRSILLRHRADDLFKVGSMRIGTAEIESAMMRINEVRSVGAVRRGPGSAFPVVIVATGLPCRELVRSFPTSISSPQVRRQDLVTGPFPHCRIQRTSLLGRGTSRRRGRV